MQEFIVSTLEDENDGDFSEGDLSLREAIATANSGDTITFNSSLSGGTINLSLGELFIDKSLTIEGLGADQLTIDNTEFTRIFNIDNGNSDSDLDVTLDGLTITGGSLSALNSNSNGFNGGGIFTTENLKLTNSLVSGNLAGSRGGGIYSSGDRLIIDNSTIESNGAFSIRVLRSTSYGGGLATVGTTVEINDSSITNNAAAVRGGGGLDFLDSQVTISNSSIADNFGTGAGGINSVNSNVEINRSVVSGNLSNNLFFGGSAGIRSDANSVLNIDRSTIDGNSSSDPFELLFSSPEDIQAFAGGIGAFGTTTITNSTISNSIVEQFDFDELFRSPSTEPPASVSQLPIGVGVRNTGNLTVINSTFSGNPDAGISNDGGTVDISNTTLADGLVNIDLTADDDSATVTSTIVVDDSQELEVAIDENNNLVGNSEDLGLGELQNNGGATSTVALLDGSPAIDAGSNPNNLTTDQRGEGFDRTVGGGTDIGAFELQTVNNEEDGDSEPPNNGDDSGGGGTIPDELVVSTLEDENDGDFSEGDLSLREALEIADLNEVITFDSSLSGGTIILSLGELAIDRSVEIRGLGADNLTIDGNNTSRIFNVNDGDDGFQDDVSIDGLTIINGNTGEGSFPEINGGAILNRENLFVTNTAFISNSAGNGGAIFNTGQINLENSLVAESNGTAPLFNDGGAAIVFNSTFTNNIVAGIGAIANTNGGTLDLSNSTLANNSGYDFVLSNSEDSTATVTSTIIANNEASLFPEFSDAGGTFISGGNNLIGNNNGAIGFDNPTDLVGTTDNRLDARLGELQDNGGATQTLALLEDSPAIDAGSNPNNLIFDQRNIGFDRTIGAGTDIGAFELQTINNEDDGDSEPPNNGDDGDRNEIIGTSVGDVLDGTESGDRILGLDGNDTIEGFGGDDTIEGNNGNDSIEGGAGNDVLNGLDGFDSLFGGEGNDTLDAGNGNDSIEGGAGNDLLFGDGDRDTLLGGDGEDTLEGGAGVDFLDGGANNDQLFGGSDNDSLRGNDGDDLLDGGAGIDSLEGGHGNDTLLGGSGNDSLFSGNGDDFINGGLGNDSLRGDDGNDTFVLTSGNGTDFIVDFNRGHNLLGLSEGIHFADLSFSGNDIILGDETLATLNGFNTSHLGENNFISI